MMFKIGAFQLPVGCEPDLRELQYISALLQSVMPDVRQEGTVSAGDIRLYLRSRYGLDITRAHAVDIVRGLGGTDPGGTAGAARTVAGDDDDEVDAASPPLPAVAEEEKEIEVEEEKEEEKEKHPAIDTGLDRSELPTTDEEMGLGSRSESEYSDSSFYEALGVRPAATTNPGRDEKKSSPTDANVCREGSARSPMSETGHSSSDFFDALEDDDFAFSLHSSKKDENDLTQDMAEDVSGKAERGTVASSKKGEDDTPQETLGHVSENSERNNLASSLKSTSLATDTNKQRGLLRGFMHRGGEAEVQEVEKDEYLDLLQLMSVLLIPTLLRAKRESDIANGIIPDDPEIPENPDTSFCFCMRHPIEFMRNLSTAAHLKKERKQRAFKDSLRPTPRRIIKDALRMMLCSMDEKHPSLMTRRGEASRDMRRKASTGNVPVLRRVAITEDVVRNLLETFGEEDAADDDELVRDMVELAGGEGTILDEIVFSRVLTSDVSAWKTGIEDELSETFFDVFGCDPVDVSEYQLERVMLEAGADAVLDTADLAVGAAATAVDAAAELVVDIDSAGHEGRAGIEAVDVKNPTKEVGKGLSKGSKQISTAPYIDYVTDSYRSVAFQMALYGYYIFSVTITMSILGTANKVDVVQCEPSFGCNLVEQIWQWLALALVLSFGGIIVLVPLSMPNDPYQHDWKRAVLSMLWLLTMTLGLFFSLEVYSDGIPHSPDGQLNDVEVLLDSFYFHQALRVYLSWGCVLAAIIFYFLISMLIPTERKMRSKVLKFMFLPANVRLCADTKQAATHKINTVLENASKLHFQKFRGTNISAAENFILTGRSSMLAGGLFWTWKNLFFTREFTKKHGIIIQSRLWIAQECQVVIVLFGVVLLVWGARTLADDAQRKREELYKEPPGNLRDAALEFVPEPYMVYVSFAFGGVFAIGVAIVLVLVYLPSTIATIFKLRSGAIQTLHEPLFTKFRAKADATFYNVGNMLYALIGSAGLFFLIFGGFMYLFIWPVTKDAMMLVLSWALGLGITITLKMVLMIFCRSAFYKALFRKRPRPANYNSLAMECWHLGVAGGTLLSRLCQFLFAAAFWVGRIDVKFLDDEVDLCGYSFDYAPTYYRQELLVHEAHKHPWIDRIGGMSMMRLRYGPGFCSNAGTKWRHLFVSALMPWLMKYRQAEKDFGEESLFASSVTSSPGRFAKLRERGAVRKVGGMFHKERKDTDDGDEI